MEGQLRFVGALQRDRWFCCDCLGDLFTPFVADWLEREGRFVELDLVVVDENDPRVQGAVCYECFWPFGALGGGE